MIARFANRLFWSFATLLGAAVLTFLLVNAVPGNVAQVIAGPKASPAVIKAIEAKFHLNEPMWKRLAYHLNSLAHGDLGQSFVTDQPVASAILDRRPSHLQRQPHFDVSPLGDRRHHGSGAPMDPFEPAGEISRL